MYVGLEVKYPLLCSEFNETCEFSRDPRKILQYKISWKSVQWKTSCSLPTNNTEDGTDTTRITVAFGYLAKAHKKLHKILDSRYKARALRTLLWIPHFTALQQHAPCYDYNKSSCQLQTMTESPVITNYMTVCTFLLVPPIRHNCFSALVTHILHNRE